MIRRQQAWSGRKARREFLKRSALIAAGLCLNSEGRARNLAPEKTRTITPKGEVIHLFNGRDLTGLYGWLKDSKFEDPRKVFSVKDALLRISGEVAGYLGTQEAYRDYRLL